MTVTHAHECLHHLEGTLRSIMVAAQSSRNATSPKWDRGTAEQPGGQSAVQRFHVSADLTGGDKNMRYALVIAMLLGSTLLEACLHSDHTRWQLLEGLD